MKKLTCTLLIMIAFICPHILKAQITLEHTFNSSVTPPSSVHFSNNTNYYVEVDALNNQIKFYNTDYSLYKITTITTPQGYELSSADYFSKTLFNNDDKIEFIVTFSFIQVPGNNSNLLTKCMLYSETGDMLNDLGTGSTLTANLHKIPDNKLRLYVQKSIYNPNQPIEYTTEIYSVPGTIEPDPSLKGEKGDKGDPGTCSCEKASIDDIDPDNKPKVYPNPTHGFITLIYKINKTEELVIYDVQGKDVMRRLLYAHQESISMDLSHLPSGTYIYKYGNVSGNIIKK